MAQIIPANYVSSCSDKVGWKHRHVISMARGHPVGKLVKAWVEYAEVQKLRYDSDIGNDYVLGDHWANLGVALRGLLIGDLGGMDAGTLDHIIYGNLTNQGFDEEGKRVKED